MLISKEQSKWEFSDYFTQISVLEIFLNYETSRMKILWNSSAINFTMAYLVLIKLLNIKYDYFVKHYFTRPSNFQ